MGHTSHIIAHDNSGHPLEVISPNALHMILQYDVRGRLEQSTRFVEGELATTTYTYTSAGDIQSISLASGEIPTYVYDDAHRLIQLSDSLGNTIDYVPDLMGNILSETVHASDNSLIKQQTAIYNQLSQLFQSIGANNQTTEYAYDPNGKINTLLDAGSNPTTQAFDALNRLISVLDAKGGG